MPRGHRKRGAWDCQIWLDDGARYRLRSVSDRAFTNADIAASLREHLVPLLDELAKPQIGAVDPPRGSNPGKRSRRT